VTDPDRLAAAPRKLVAHLLGVPVSAIASRESGVTKRQAPGAARQAKPAGTRHKATT
jgi:hypothetical protein